MPNVVSASRHCVDPEDLRAQLEIVGMERIEERVGSVRVEIDQREHRVARPDRRPLVVEHDESSLGRVRPRSGQHSIRYPVHAPTPSVPGASVRNQAQRPKLGCLVHFTKSMYAEVTGTMGRPPEVPWSSAEHTACRKLCHRSGADRRGRNWESP